MALGVVLAGRRNAGALAAACPEAQWEALIPIGGRPMAAYVIDALTMAAGISAVVVAGPAELARPGVIAVTAGDGVAGSLAAALEAACQLEPDVQEVVIATGDAPLLTPAAVGDVLAQARARALDFGYPVIARQAAQASYPGVRRTYVRLREGSFTGGNCFYLRVSAAPAVLALLGVIHRERKRPLRLAGLLGWRVVWGVLTGRARLAAVEAAATRLLGHPAGALTGLHPGIGVDVDDAGDLGLCRALLGEGPRP